MWLSRAQLHSANAKRHSWGQQRIKRQRKPAAEWIEGRAWAEKLERRAREMKRII
jgi:hypothetical protein